MGAWGSGPFENDDAADWVWELEDDTDASVLSATLAIAVDTPADDYLEVDDANNAIAAAEVVASARGTRSPQLPTEAVAWLDTHAALVDPPLVALARKAVQRVSENSEARDLWDDAGNTSWGEYVAALLDRLR